MNQEKSTMLNVIMSHELKELLKELAAREKRSMSAEVVYIIEQYLKNHSPD